MKSSKNQNDKIKKSVFGQFSSLGKKKDPEFDFDFKKRGIRHLDSPIEGFSNVNHDDGKYGKTENLSDEWGLADTTSVRSGRRKKFIGAIIAAAVIALVLISVFVILPAVLPNVFKGTNIELFVEKAVNLEYDSSTRVITSTAESIMEEPDVASERITQALYNEPVTIIEEDTEGTGYIKIQTADGIEGYVKAADVTTNTDSVEPDLHEYKLVVSETYKNVMTAASNGTLITKVMMNTVLYADVKRDGVYEVTLPDGTSGWIGSSGVIELDPRETIQEVSSRYFISSALSFANALYLENGMTLNGISDCGLIYVCSAVNGITMPRTLSEQAQMGQEVELEYDVVTGDLLVDSILPGDIVFLRDGETGSKITDAAICTDTGTLLMISSARTTIRLTTFDSSSKVCNRIVSVRRVFSD